MLGVPQAWGQGRGESYTLFQTLPIPEEILLIFVCGKSSLLLDNVNIVYESLGRRAAVL